MNSQTHVENIQEPSTALPIVKVNTLGYVTFDTPDVERLSDYYQTSLGFTLVEGDADEAYLSADGEQHTVILRKNETAKGRTRVGYRLDGELADARKHLAEAGYRVERRTDVSPTETEVLVLQEPQTNTPIHLYDSSVKIAGAPADPLTPVKLGHVATYVPELASMQAFYQSLLGFEWSDTLGDFFVFLRCNNDHHAANFMQSSSFAGMHHVAYELRDMDHVQRILDNLAKNDVRLHWGPGRHGPGHNVFTYHRDPDGNVIELFTQLDQWNTELAAFDPRPWHEDSPQVPKSWEADYRGNVWGPGNPEARKR